MTTFLSVCTFCATAFSITTLILLAQDDSKLRDIGKELAKWMAAAFCLFLVFSPIDLAPDVLPGGGWLDDVGYLVACVAAARSALNDRKERLRIAK